MEQAYALLPAPQGAGYIDPPVQSVSREVGREGILLVDRDADLNRKRSLGIVGLTDGVQHRVEHYLAGQTAAPGPGEPHHKVAVASGLDLADKVSAGGVNQPGRGEPRRTLTRENPDTTAESASAAFMKINDRRAGLFELATEGLAYELEGRPTIRRWKAVSVIRPDADSVHARRDASTGLKPAV